MGQVKAVMGGVRVAYRETVAGESAASVTLDRMLANKPQYAKVC